MSKKRKRSLRRIASLLVVLAAICMMGYFSICYWINASGSLLSNDTQNIDQGTAIEISGKNRKDGVFTLLVCATDEEALRTDSMMVMTFDTNNRMVSVLNIPRDTMVDTRRKGAGRKINAAYADGVDQMLEEVSSVIGFRPDKYIVANFDGIAEIVDTIGGVDYDVPFDMSYHDASQDLSIEFEAGMQHLDGKKVVEFLRWRHNDDGTGYENGDMGRVEKLQTFLTALADEVLSPTNILKIPSLASSVSNNVQSDLTTSQILWVGMQGMQVDMENVKMETLYGDAAEVNVGMNLWFFIADEDMVIDQINASFNPYTRTLTEDDFDIVTPDSLGFYSRNWEDEKEVRYAMYEKENQRTDGDDDTDEDIIRSYDYD